MRLTFPNPSRSYDASRSRIGFWGYDSTIEISFFIEADALKQQCPGMEDTETGFLKAFDTALDRIHEVADKVYIEGGKGKGSYVYILSAKDF